MACPGSIANTIVRRSAPAGATLVHHALGAQRARHAAPLLRLDEDAHHGDDVFLGPGLADHRLRGADPAPASRMPALNADIAIVGSGAAGGVLAATLAEFTNKKIVLIEKGGHYTKDWFDQRELDMNVLYADRGARTTQDGAIPVQGGECIGGGTTVNYALSFDPRQDVWRYWKREFGVGPFSFDRSSNDFGIGGLNMAGPPAHPRK